MLEFIPFIPASTPGISKTLWQTALDSWMLNLIELLNMPQDKFMKEVSSNTTLPSFIDQVLNEQMNNESQPVDTNLIKYIFLLYSKLSSVSVATELLDIARLCSFVIVYSESNIEQVRRIMTDTINNSEALEQSLISTIGSLTESVQSMPNLLANTKPITIDILDRAYVLVRVLDALLSSTIYLDVVKSSFDPLDEILIECYRELIPGLKDAVKTDSSLESHAYLIKLTLVSCFNSFADVQFFIPLGFTSSIVDHNRLLTHHTEINKSIIEVITKKVLGYIEESDIDSSRNAFIDGSLILDWEIEFHISEKFGFINQNAFDGDEDRLEFLKLSMEQVRDSNDGTGHWGDKVKSQKANKHTLEPNTTNFQDVERTSMISQVHDLFPDLGDGFIEACLEANNDNVETVIMQLLEDKLPDSVSGLDRSMERKPLVSANDAVSELIHLESEATVNDNRIQQSVLESRRNIYDNDEFDIFTHRTVDASKVYEGKKDKGNADSLLDDKSFIQGEKKNVLQLVVDMYDDDYDDTYDDINDAGQPVVMESDDALDIVRKKPTSNANNNTDTEKSESGSHKQQPKASDKGKQTQKGPSKNDNNNKSSANVTKDKKSPATPTKDSKSSAGSTKNTKSPANAAKDKKSPAAVAKDRTNKVKNKASIGNHNRKANRDKKMAKMGPPPE